MDKKKSQHYNFCYDVIPALFHSQTNDFMMYIDRDGVKFLEFWWNHVGSQLPAEQLVSFANTKMEIEERSPSQRIIFITLPPPLHEQEMYFLALVRNPERHFAWVRLPSTRILGLVKRSKDTFESGTELGDLTPRAIFVSQGVGPVPSLGEFKKLVFEMTKSKKPA
jgi:hypothetical protein